MKILPLYPQLPYLALENELTQPMNLDPGCQRCPLHEKVRSPCLPAEGDPGGLLVIGEAPIAEDDRQTMPFVSPTGAWVRQQIKKNWTGPVVYDNAIRCWPGAREVTKAHIANCRPYLAGTYLEAMPQRILALGPDAFVSVIGRSYHSLSARRGYAIMPSTGVPVFMLIPPAIALKNRYIRPLLEEDIAWALTAVPRPPPTDGTAMYVQTAEEAEEACFDLHAGGELSYDAETFGVPFDQEFKIVTLAICNVGAHHAYVWDEEAIRDPGRSGPLRRLLENPRVPKGGQNIKYDKLAARGAFGAKIGHSSFDVRLIRKLLEANALITGLDVMQPRVGMGGGKDEAAEHVKVAVQNIRNHVANLTESYTPKGKLRAKKAVEPLGLAPDVEAIMLARVQGGVDPKRYAMAFLPEHVRGVYCARDAVSTGLLKEVYYGELAERPELKEHWEQVVVPLEHAITQMEWNGVKISVPALHQLGAALTAKIGDLNAKLAPYVWEGFNANASSGDTGKLLFNQATDTPPGLGLKPTRLTPTGKPGTALEDIEDIQHPVVPLVLELRKALHFKSTYHDGLGWHVRDNGRIHTSYKIDGTTTGRPSTENPNLLNIPRAESPDGKMCRDLFISEDDYVLVEGDYNQIELRVAAMLSQDEVMIEVFKSGQDFHLATAKMVAPHFGFHPDDIDKKHPLRSRSKTINFGVLYGKDAFGIAAELGISKKEAQATIDAILGRFRKLATWIQQQLAEGRRTGYTRTWWNNRWARYRPLPDLGGWNEEERLTAERSTWNTPIQGTATEFTNASLGAIQRTIEEEAMDARLVLTVYDSIVSEVHKSAVTEYVEHANRIMTGWESMGMPIKADFKVGTSWGTMEEIHV